MARFSTPSLPVALRLGFPFPGEVGIVFPWLEIASQTRIPQLVAVVARDLNIGGYQGRSWKEQG